MMRTLPALLLAATLAGCSPKKPAPALLELSQPGVYIAITDRWHGTFSGKPAAAGTLIVVRGGEGSARMVARGCGDAAGVLVDDGGVTTLWVDGAADSSSVIAAALCSGHPALAAPEGGAAAWAVPSTSSAGSLAGIGLSTIRPASWWPLSST